MDTIKFFRSNIGFFVESRKKLGLTQSIVAERAGVLLSKVADVEVGRRTFSEELQEKFWSVLVCEDLKQRMGPTLGQILGYAVTSPVTFDKFLTDYRTVFQDGPPHQSAD